MNETKIALTGKMRSGKSTVAEYISKEYSFERFSFSTALKGYVYEIFGLSDFSGKKPRRLLQDFGQFCRSIDPDVWVRHCFDAIRWRENMAGRKLNIVIDDLRQPNEHDRCRAEGFVIVRVTAPDEVRIERMWDAGEVFDAETFEHETESYVDSFAVDYEIENGGSLAELYAQVDRMMDDLGVKKITEVVN